MTPNPVRESKDWSWPFDCVVCGGSYPSTGFPYLCPTCGGIYDFSQGLDYSPSGPPRLGFRGLSRFLSTIPLPPHAELISLGEGETPIVTLQIQGRTVHFKCEHLNPTGSFKDRGSVALVSALSAMGVEEAVEDSSGNAGASFAAYASRAGIHARVFVPSYASGPKQAQIQAYGAEIVRVPGPRSEAAAAVRRAADAGAVYASHVYLPHGLAGMATVAFEIVEQLGRTPGAVILPVGHGSLLLGMYRGFLGMVKAGEIGAPAPLVGVQARACAPIWTAYTQGEIQPESLTEGETIAEGIRILRPPRAEAVLNAVRKSDGRMVAVDEASIREGRNALAERGLYVEATSAVVWPALMMTINDLKDPIVVIITGSGYKDS
ncbi:MAG: pyridoxal-phosphate dependent enzyme [Anaerolineaceae bacterium]|nr:MAG: pyridoxal-phosphate dependent enzyme [Anaerolineaceae bacterium]